MSGWGQGTINNTIGWGQGSTNDIGWGAIYADSPSGDTAISAPSFTNVYSASFDGADDYITTDATYSVLDGLDKMSISLWVKPDNLSLYQFLMSSIRNAILNNFQFCVVLSTTGEIRFFTETTGIYTYTNTSVITAGTWHHVLICLDKTQAVNANRCRIYVNGADATGGFNNQGTASLYTSTSNLSFGINQNGKYDEFGGNLDEVSIWADTQLTSGDATTLYNSGTPTNLEDFATLPDNWWRMGETDSGTGTTLTDVLGSADATLINDTAYTEDVPT